MPFIRIYEPFGDVLCLREYVSCRSYCCRAVAKSDTDAKDIAAASVSLFMDQE